MKEVVKAAGPTARLIEISDLTIGTNVIGKEVFKQVYESIRLMYSITKKG